MKKIATFMAGAAALAALICAGPAYADDQVSAPGNDVFAAQTPDGGSYTVQLAPERPVPEDAEEDDEMVVFWW
jgi:hypothetical protein